MLLLLFVAAGLESVSVGGGVARSTVVANVVGPPGSQGVDLLAALALHNTSRQGVSPAEGPQQRGAYYLQGTQIYTHHKHY